MLLSALSMPLPARALAREFAREASVKRHCQCSASSTVRQKKMMSLASGGADFYRRRTSVPRTSQTGGLAEIRSHGPCERNAGQFCPRSEARGDNFTVVEPQFGRAIEV